jgi:hypothetical protein
MDGTYITHGELRNGVQIVAGKPEGKIMHERPRRRQDDIKMDLKQYGSMWTGFMRLKIWTVGQLL